MSFGSPYLIRDLPEAAAYLCAWSDCDASVEAAARAGVYVELNASPHRLDLDTAACRLARSLGVRLAIDPDAHDAQGLEDVRYGVGIARRAGLRASDVLNTLPADALDRALARPR